MDNGQRETDAAAASQTDSQRASSENGAARPPIRYGLLGRTLGHSWSPLIHEHLGSVPYELVELEPEELGPYVRGGAWEGLNVTIPYKREAAQLADVTSERVKRLGVANTLVRMPDGRILADNTDVLGFAWMLERFCSRELGMGAAEALDGREVLVLGSGGASQAVQAALADAGAQAAVISRSGADGYDTIAERHAGARLVVNTTPVGMYPNCPASPVPAETLAALPGLAGVLDVVYNPERTGICLAAEQLGIPSESGLAMLVAQALFSSGLWQGRGLDDSVVAGIEAAIRAQTQNVVLIGMPGSGKTSCGRELAALTKRPFTDLDHAFAERYGRSAAQVIEAEGEGAFRAMETEVLAEFSKGSGQVLSCGGGVVTRPENLGLMRQNGVVIMLDRDLAQLSTKGRPLSASRGVSALAAERMPLYRSWANHIMRCTGSARGDAEEICRILGLEQPLVG